MSESNIYGATGLPVQQNAPPPNMRRTHWLNELKQVPPRMHGKYWVQQKQQLVNELQSILDRVEAEARPMTEKEELWYSATEQDMKWVDTTKVQPYQEEQERLKDSATPHGTADALNGEGLRAKLARLQAQPGPTGRRYSDLFPGSLDLGGFKSASEFFAVFSAGLSDPRMLQMMGATMQEVGTNNGGAVVPSEMARQWLDSSLETEIVRPRAKNYPMQSDSLKVAGFDMSDNSTNAPAGFKAVWSAENDEAIPQMGKFLAILFHANKLKLYAEASAELAADGLNFDAQVGDMMTRALGWGLDSSFLVSGNGAGMPTSVLNDVALITVAKEPGQAGQTIVYENILKMFARLHPASMSKAVWVANSTALPQLLTLSVGIGAAGVLMPAVKEQSGKFSLLGMELIFSEKLNQLGTKGDLLLVDFSQYAVAMRKEIILEKSNLPGWSRDVMSYRIITRCDGKGTWSKAQIPKNGDSRSWAVALATRA